MTNNFAIRVQNLSKYYGSTLGIADVNLQVKLGQIHGFLGPNGAGKTTTIRILVGLLNKSGGDAYIFDEIDGSIASKQIIGYLPSDFELYKYYTVAEYLNFIEKLRGKAPYKEELVARLDVDVKRKTTELSRGNKQKVAIVQALMHEPKLLIADEPTTGLDPLMQEEFNKLIREYVSRGNTAFISSHLLTEVQDICDYVDIIKEGIIVSSGKVSELLDNLPRKAILKLEDGISIEEIRTKLNCNVDGFVNEKLTVYFDYSALEFIDKLREIKGIIDFTLPEPDLEEYFLSFYGS